MTFNYNKKNAKCMWCKRTQNPHPDYSYETIPTKIFTSKKGRKVELCFSCFENEKDISREKLLSMMAGGEELDKLEVELQEMDRIHHKN